MRLNSAVARLERGEAAIGPWPVACGDVYELERLADSEFDFVMIDAEHRGFEFVDLRRGLQAMMARYGRTAPMPAPLVRLPTNASERNEWLIKQVLDLGVLGLALPRVETAEDAQAFVSAARYPDHRDRPINSPDLLPGRRGSMAYVAARYWGIDVLDYHRRARPWPLASDGEVLLVGMIESRRGLANLEEICLGAPGLAALWLGTGDLAADMGMIGERHSPEIAEAVVDFGIRCRRMGMRTVILCDSKAEAAERIEQGFDMVLMPAWVPISPPRAQPQRAASPRNATPGSVLP